MRREIKYTVTDSGRDQGKTFLITEFSARKGEDWSLKVIFAIMNSGIDLPEGIEKLASESLSMVGVMALFTTITKLKFEVAKPLLDELLEGVQILPDISKPHYVRELLHDDFEEVMTISKIRVEVIKLNLDFLKAVVEFLTKKFPAAKKENI